MNRCSCDDGNAKQTLKTNIRDWLAQSTARLRSLSVSISRFGGDLPSEGEIYEPISQRIEALVNEGQLSVQGNIKKWRFSEVRRADADRIALATSTITLATFIRRSPTTERIASSIRELFIGILIPHFAKAQCLLKTKRA